MTAPAPVDERGRATKIVLTDIKSVPMRAFHLSWLAFLTSFFAWFAIAPLLPLVREDLGLTPRQLADAAIASVAVTIVARLIVGWSIDRVGPRRTYAVLLVVGAIPVAAIGLVQTATGFLLARLAIGVVGASFVITTNHTTRMFAPSCVGTANATAAGWGNLGGGLANLAMPLVVAALGVAGVGASLGWRLAMLLPAAAMIAVAIPYVLLTRDDPEVAGQPAPAKPKGSMMAAIRDPRTWGLALAYGACFGVELTVNNVAATYFRDTFHIGVTAAGLLAGLHGLTNLFARASGGWLGDRAGRAFGLGARARLLAILLGCEGLLLMVFSQTTSLGAAIPVFVVFSVCVAMSAGATYAVVPFIGQGGGAVAGVVGAGGNVGAVLAGFLVRTDGLPARTALLYLGEAVVAIAVVVAVIRFAVVRRPVEVQVPRSIATDDGLASVESVA